MSELRQDPITREWVIISPERNQRPKDTPESHLPCPFCPGNERLTPEPTDVFTDGGSWSVRAIPNRFAALAPQQGVDLTPQDPSGWRRLAGHGYHEVIIESPDHQAALGTLPEPQVRRVLEMYLRRYRALAEADGTIRQVVLFRNHGRSAGTSLSHPHSQIIATPVVAPETRRRLAEDIEFFDTMGSCGCCSLIERERRTGVRIAAQSAHFVALAPFASRAPYQMQIIPQRHCPAFPEITGDELDDLAACLRAVLGAYHERLNNPAHNLVIVTPPLDQVHRHANHWFIDILPRLTTPAGFELGSRMVINPQPPESAAADLRVQLGISPAAKERK